MKLLVYEGMRVEFWPTLDATGSVTSYTGVASDPRRPYSGTEQEFTLTRNRAPSKKESAVPSELPEVVNLARDYDRWDQYEAPPPTED